MSSNRDGTTAETFHSSSLGPVNITSFDAMQEIAIHDNSSTSQSSSSMAVGGHGSLSSTTSSSRQYHHQFQHHRPATLPLEPASSGSIHSNDIINSSAIITASSNSVSHGGLVGAGGALSCAGGKHTPMDALKEWSMSTYKCTKQLINEKLGKCSRTVDADLEIEIEKLRDTQHKYECILKLCRDMSNQYCLMIQTQNAMFEHFNELALRETKSTATSPLNNSSSGTIDPLGHRDSSTSPSNNNNSLSHDFKQNAEMMKSIAKNGDKLLMALRFFISNLSTLIYKTIEDTIITIRAFEAARLEYDAERNSLNGLSATLCGSTATNSATNTTGSSNQMPTTSPITTSEKVNQVRSKYERLKEDVIIKMKFLEENKAKVMHKQLVLFHNAFAAFASGNAQALDSTLKQFSIRPQTSSFLEK